MDPREERLKEKYRRWIASLVVAAGTSIFIFSVIAAAFGWLPKEVFTVFATITSGLAGLAVGFYFRSKA